MPNEEEILFQTAFGKTGLGMPKIGNPANIDANLLQTFRDQYMTSEGCLLVGSGVRDHGEFVQMAEEYLVPALPSRGPNKLEREPTVYEGGVCQIDNGS